MKRIIRSPLIPLLCASLLAACSSDESFDAAQNDESVGLAGAARGDNQLLPIDDGLLSLRQAPNPERNAYYGDLHVHTANSFDAYVFGTTSTPADAYRYARGRALPHPNGYEVQLQQPLDFTDIFQFTHRTFHSRHNGMSLNHPYHRINIR